ncbi:ferredoxin reductase family protein [Spirochaeta africana]|uniref:Putative ferric reductase n=1 Tax=Spirochaeta africana (strain ATCC 700263 / DSM 8902 / Z-7692) TaxID=889378 RepID=H9UI59_SPIAZ|nr:ferric reductase-like transmembrane domain-containing protein [Spirochaeta africana]AFG37202.1 putative ferric reductase [Spirochaeta africana DSM 8902]
MAVHRLPPRRDWVGYATVLASVLVAYGLWIGYLALDDAFYDTWKLYPAKIGSHTSVLLMSWAILLATRLPPFEWLFNGLDKLYKAHRRIGVWAFLIVFLHPVFLAAAFTDAVPEFFAFFWFSDSVVRNTGVAALLGFIVLVVLSIAVRIAYHRWKRSHDFFGLLLMLVAAHLILAEGEIMAYRWLRTWHLGWIGAALLGYLYIRLLYRFFGPLYDYSVTRVETVGDSITEIYLKPGKRTMRHHPGQFLYVSFDSATIGSEPHPITIASEPAAAEIRLSVKALGDWTEKLSHLQPGERARIWGPYGRFSQTMLEHPYVPVILVGGGIGITPFLSIIRDQEFASREADSLMIYAVTDRSSAVYQDELHESARQLPHLETIIHYSEEQGYLDAAYLTEIAQRPLSEYYYMVCGPPALMESLRSDLKAAGVPRNHIRMEEFAV